MALDVLGQCILEHKVRKIVAIAGKQKQFKSFTTRPKTHTRGKNLLLIDISDMFACLCVLLRMEPSMHDGLCKCDDC